MEINIVLGSQFGDEGKGSFTNFLCTESKKKNQNPIVIRFNGGHQAGHTVLHNNNRHTFSSFGSGTLQNVPTYWAEYCTVYPIALLNEFKKLKELGIKPEIYFDPLCPITTPYDIYANISNENKNNHGSVGVGFGTTIKRQESFYKLYLQDLFNDTVLKGKLLNIKSYYTQNYHIPDLLENEINIWYNSIKELIKEGILSKDNLGIDNIINNEYDNLIFEGAQGILLDMDFGFFPNVTRSNTTSKNVYNWMQSKFNINLNNETHSIFYITRPYQTRHGLGYMTNRDFIENNQLIPLELINTENEINLDTSFQGIFRKSFLDIDLLEYATTCDANISNSQLVNKTLVISCLDQIPGEIKYTIEGKLNSSNIENLLIVLKKKLNINNYFLGQREGVFTKTKVEQYVI